MIPTNSLLSAATLSIPVPEPRQTISISPIFVALSDRSFPLRITLPTTGSNHPIVIIAHGHGPSLYIPSQEGYAPLAGFYAAHGFAVIQPTGANSKFAGLSKDTPGYPLFWRERVREIKAVIDNLDAIEAENPLLKGRLDKSRIAAAGHSAGGQTVGMLLGARLTDIKDPEAQDVNVIEPRIKAGVLLGAPGRGGDSLNDFARENYTMLNADFSHMTTPSLTVIGDADESLHLSVKGPMWHADSFYYSPSPGGEYLLSLHGGKHGMGGISGWDAKEADDEDPDRLEITRRMTWAYLWSKLYDGDEAWAKAVAGLREHASALAKVEAKSS